MNNKKSSAVTSYNKWGYIFLIPFAAAFIVFQLIPLCSTIYNSLFENYMSGLKRVGPNFVGLANFAKLETYFCENAMCIILGWDAHYIVTAEGAQGYYLMDGGRLNVAGMTK